MGIIQVNLSVGNPVKKENFAGVQQVKKKTPEFSSTVLPAPSLYHLAHTEIFIRY